MAAPEVNETETVAFSEQREMRKKLGIPDSAEWIPDSLYWHPIWRKKNFTDLRSAFLTRNMMNSGTNIYSVAKF